MTGEGDEGLVKARDAGGYDEKLVWMEGSSMFYSSRGGEGRMCVDIECSGNPLERTHEGGGEERTVVGSGTLRADGRMGCGKQREERKG